MTESETVSSDSTEKGTTSKPDGHHPIFRCSTGGDSLGEEEEQSLTARELASLQLKFESLKEEAGLLEHQLNDETEYLREEQEQLER